MHLCGLSYAARRKRDKNHFTEARNERKGKDRLLSYRVLSRVFAFFAAFCSVFIQKRQFGDNRGCPQTVVPETQFAMCSVGDHDHSSIPKATLGGNVWRRSIWLALSLSPGIVDVLGVLAATWLRFYSRFITVSLSKVLYRGVSCWTSQALSSGVSLIQSG